MSRVAALIAVLVLVGMSGCATVSITTEVGDAHTIERYDFNVTTSTTVYGFLNEAAKDDGYDGLRGRVLNGSTPDGDRIEYSEEITGNEAHISVRATYVPVENLTGVTIEERDGQLVFEDRTFLNESTGETSSGADSLTSGLVLQYTLVMPNEITESNADGVEGNEATWRRTGPDAMTNTTIRARSDEPSEVAGPGFGAVPALVGLLLSIAVLAHRE